MHELFRQQINIAKTKALLFVDHYLWTTILFMGLALEIVVFLIMPVDLGTYAALFTFILAIVSFWIEMKAARADLNREVREVILPPFDASQFEQGFGWEVLAHSERVPGTDAQQRTQAGFSTRINKSLIEREPKFLFQDGRWVARKSPGWKYRKTIIRHLRRPNFFNGVSIRQITDLEDVTIENQGQVRIQETDYVSGLLTNGICNKKLYDDSLSDGEPLLDGLKATLLPDTRGCINGLIEGQNSSANIVGVSVLALSLSSQWMLYTIQGKNSVERPGKIAPSGSGSLDDRDMIGYGKSGELKELIGQGMLRELQEETSIDLSSVLIHEVIGYARLLDRGGKPEYFGVAITDLDESAIKRKLAERGFVDSYQFEGIHTNSASLLRRSIESQISQMTENSNASIQVVLNLMFLADALSNPNSKVSKFLEKHYSEAAQSNMSASDS